MTSSGQRTSVHPSGAGRTSSKKTRMTEILRSGTLGDARPFPPDARKRTPAEALSEVAAKSQPALVEHLRERGLGAREKEPASAHENEPTLPEVRSGRGRWSSRLT